MTVRELVATLMCVPEEGWDCEIMIVADRVASCTGVLGDGDVPGTVGFEDINGWHLLIQENSKDPVQ